MIMIRRVIDGGTLQQPDRLIIWIKRSIVEGKMIMLKTISNGVVKNLSQRLSGTSDVGIIPTALLAAGANMAISRKNIPVGMALIAAALLLLELNRRNETPTNLSKKMVRVSKNTAR